MKKSFLIAVLTSLLLGLTASDTTAQIRRQPTKKKPSTSRSREKEESVPFKDHLWYGLGGGVGFGGDQNFSAFQLSLVPMVGYKFTNYFSAGPRMGFTYTYIKGVDNFNNISVVQPVDFVAAAFTRLKFFQLFFLHAEYGIESQSIPFTDNFGRLIVEQQTGKVLTERFSNDMLNIGGGYNNGMGNLGYEFGVYYKALEPKESLSLPFDLRVALTYRF
jgi:hypothetical protein